VGTDIVIYFSPAEERHNGRANVVYLDDHVESHTLEELGYVVQNGVAQPQTSPTLTTASPWGSNAFWNGVGYDETSPNYSKVQ
jgi:prepilin-type processing-associated H-X9-DG protein